MIYTYKPPMVPILAPRERAKVELGDKFTLELNSHSLSDFQHCEQKFKFSEIDALTPKGEYYPFKRGSAISRYLALWYTAKKKEFSPDRMAKLEFQLFKKMARSPSFKNLNTGKNDGYLIGGRLTEYFNKYRNEKLKVIAVEQGFSKIIHEDDNYLFIYSGKPDLVVDFGPNYGIGWLDHKSESRESNIAKFNNQFLGYSWALSSLVGMINYVGLQNDSRDGSVLRREAVGYNQGEIDRWREDTTSWFYRVAETIQKRSFLRGWRCDTKYGLCPFYNLCTSGSVNEESLKIEREFVRLEAPYKSW